jgi:hypothetical protein
MAKEIEKEEGQEEAAAPEKPLEDMTVKELREIAHEIPGVSGLSTMKKDELLDLVRKSREGGEGGKLERPVFKKPLEKMTVKELREIAVDIPGVTGVTAMKKEQLVTLVREYWELEEEEKPVKEKKEKAKPAVSAKVLKEKIVALKAEKEKAREAQDKRGVMILRRRINRLKKRTRKVAQG